MNLTPEALQGLWRSLNVRYFNDALAPIPIEWSDRLTASAGLFVSHKGPRGQRFGSAPAREKRLIRLSAPLLQGPDTDSDGALLATLAHEMIHQWQFDVLKRRPNHGPDFCRKMTDMNRDGLGITIRHRMEGPRALAKYAWQCQRCGRAYERRRCTIDPRRHRCGVCRGTLRELSAPSQSPSPTAPERPLAAGLHDRLTRLNRGARVTQTTQLTLPFGGTI